MTENEKLILCAKAVGKYLNPAGDLTVDEAGHWIDYDPYTNDAQAWELFKWLVDEHLGHDFVKRAQGGYWAFQGGKLIGISDTLNEAIIKAVVAMEESK